MRILFLPSDMGGGFGHISRCLALADTGRRRGHHCVFALHNSRHGSLVQRRFPVRLCRPHGRLTGAAMRLRTLVKKKRRALFTEFTGLDYQVPRDGLLSPGDVERRLTQYRRVVRTEKPDLVVGDTNLVVRLLAAATGLPSVQLVRYASHPDTARLIWWKDQPNHLVPPRTAGLFNPLLGELGLPEIERAEDLLRGDLHLVPSLPEIEPVTASDNTVHVGALVESGADEELPPSLAGLDRDRPLVYATLGGGAGLVGNAELTRRLIEACAGQPFQVVLSTGGTVSESDLGPLPDNLFPLFRWAPGQTLVGMARAVVFHGGYGTMMEVLAAGKPCLAIPHQTEQEGNARRLEQLGCGLVLKPSSSDPVTVTAHWPQGDYTWDAQSTCDLTVDEIRGALHRLMAEESFTTRAKALQQKLSRLSGPQLALDLLERLLR